MDAKLNKKKIKNTKLLFSYFQNYLTAGAIMTVGSSVLYKINVGEKISQSFNEDTNAISLLFNEVTGNIIRPLFFPVINAPLNAVVYIFRQLYRAIVEFTNIFNGEDASLLNPSLIVFGLLMISIAIFLYFKNYQYGAKIIKKHSNSNSKYQKYFIFLLNAMYIIIIIMSLSSYFVYLARSPEKEKDYSVQKYFNNYRQPPNSISISNKLEILDKKVSMLAEAIIPDTKGKTEIQERLKSFEDKISNILSKHKAMLNIIKKELNIIKKDKLEFKNKISNLSSKHKEIIGIMEIHKSELQNQPAITKNINLEEKHNLIQKILVILKDRTDSNPINDKYTEWTECIENNLDMHNNNSILFWENHIDNKKYIPSGKKENSFKDC